MIWIPKLVPTLRHHARLMAMPTYFYFLAAVAGPLAGVAAAAGFLAGVSGASLRDDVLTPR